MGCVVPPNDKIMPPAGGGVGTGTAEIGTEVLMLGGGATPDVEGPAIEKSKVEGSA